MPQPPRPSRSSAPCGALRIRRAGQGVVTQQRYPRSSAPGRTATDDRSRAGNKPGPRALLRHRSSQCVSCPSASRRLMTASTVCRHRLPQARAAGNATSSASCGASASFESASPSASSISSRRMPATISPASSLRSSDPQRVERRPARPGWILDSGAGEHVGPEVRTPRRQRQPHVDGERRPAAQTLARDRVRALVMLTAGWRHRWQFVARGSRIRFAIALGRAVRLTPTNALATTNRFSSWANDGGRRIPQAAPTRGPRHSMVREPSASLHREPTPRRFQPLHEILCAQH